MSSNRKSLYKIAEPWNYGIAALPHNKAVYVSELLSSYVLSDRYRKLSDNTKKGYASIYNTLDNLILANNKSIFSMYAHKVDYSTVEYLKSVYGFSRKPSTIAAHFSFLSSAWEHGLRCGWVALNPWRRAGISIKNFRDVVWTDAQVKLAIKVAKDLGYTQLALYLLLAYETAQRPWSDIRELKWSNVKEDNGSTILDFVIVKTTTHLLLPLSSAAADALRLVPKTSEYIFANSSGKRLSVSALYLQFCEVKKQAGLPEELMVRDLRRTAVTQMCMAGATLAEIQSMTGWHVPASMLQRYAVLRLPTAKKALEKREQFRNSDEFLSSGA